METRGEARGSDLRTPPPVAAVPATAPAGAPPPGAWRGGMPSAAGVVDPAGRIAGNVPCRRCSYDLHGLSVTGRCPECDAPVGVAVHGDLLRYGDPEWVRGLSRGAGLAFWGILVSIGATIAGMFIAAMTTPLLAPLIQIAGEVVYLYGAWLLTSPDPSGLGEDRYGRARQIIRIALLAGVAESALEFVTLAATLDRGTTIAVNVAQVGLGLVGLVGQFAMLHYLQRLALRIPSEPLSKRARTVFWGYGGSLAALMLIGGGIALAAMAANRFGGAGQGGDPALMGAVAAAGCASLVVLVCLLVFGVMFLILLLQLQRAFDREADDARVVWSGAGGA